MYVCVVNFVLTVISDLLEEGPNYTRFDGSTASW